MLMLVDYDLNYYSDSTVKKNAKNFQNFQDANSSPDQAWEKAAVVLR